MTLRPRRTTTRPSQFTAIAWLLVVTPLAVAAVTSSAAAQTSPEARAVAFLVKEVPRWKAEHPCYSCHNNGDATRALLVARANGHDIGTALDDTLKFLNDPARWDQNKTQGGDDDKPLARLHFASALAV